MQRRSRKGCIDCKRAKVKCDEEQPHCGTCKRRGYVCQGYAKHGPKAESKPASGPATTLSQIQRSKAEPQPPTVIPHRQRDERRQSTKRSSPHDIFPSHMQYTERRITTIACARGNKYVPLRSCPPLYPTLSDLPPDAVKRTDQPGVAVYFNRHPPDLVLSEEFVAEMNAIVLQVFNKDPAAVGETLSAIGQIYLVEEGSSIVPVLVRKQRILARLRDRRDLEQMMVMFLGLCALELIDGRAEPADNCLPAIISNAAIIIKHQHDAGLTISSVAKYFIRALARQDMMISLTYGRRPLIPNSVWLSSDSCPAADRFMGYTGTLMPILADLGALAGNIRGRTPIPSDSSCSCSNSNSNKSGSHLNGDVCTGEATMITTNQTLAIYQKVLDVRRRLNQWRPVATPNISLQASRNLLFHAHSHRAAALLYLHRLLEPPGSSAAADQIASGMAHEVLMPLGAMTDQLKTSLWPLLIAGTELTEDGDRGMVKSMFDVIVGRRKTVTARRTRNFCILRVWTARDEGLPWNWMDLAKLYPGECLPI